MLKIVAASLSRDKDVELYDILGFLDRYRLSTRPVSSSYEMRADDRLGINESYINQFRTNEELREFLEVVYRKRIPPRLSKENLRFLALGITSTSDIPLMEAIEKWEKRNSIVHSKNLYSTNREDLVRLLNDDSVFPDGYSIVTFANKFHIRLPRIRDRSKLINILLEKLYDRPLGSKEIGRWGLSDQGRKQ